MGNVLVVCSILKTANSCFGYKLHKLQKGSIILNITVANNNKILSNITALNRLHSNLNPQIFPQNKTTSSSSTWAATRQGAAIGFMPAAPT